jgi:hypothetical protein
VSTSGWPKGANWSLDRFQRQRASIGRFLQEALMIQKTNKSVAVDVREEARERFWKAVEEIGERNADKDPDEVLRVVTEVVEEVRQERYAREQCAKRGH